MAGASRTICSSEMGGAGWVGGWTGVSAGVSGLAGAVGGTSGALATGGATGAPVLRSPSSVAILRRVDSTAEGGPASGTARFNSGLDSWGLASTIVNPVSTASSAAATETNGAVATGTGAVLETPETALASGSVRMTGSASFGALGGVAAEVRRVSPVTEVGSFVTTCDPCRPAASSGRAAGGGACGATFGWSSSFSLSGRLAGGVFSGAPIFHLPSSIFGFGPRGIPSGAAVGGEAAAVDDAPEGGGSGPVAGLGRKLRRGVLRCLGPGGVGVIN